MLVVSSLGVNSLDFNLTQQNNRFKINTPSDWEHRDSITKLNEAIEPKNCMKSDRKMEG